MLTSVLIVIWVAVSISVFHTCWNIYLLLGLWNLKVLAKWWHNLRQYLNAGFCTHYFFIYIWETSVTWDLQGFFALDFIYIYDELASFHPSLLWKFYTLSSFKRIKTKSFHRILLILSSGVSLNPGPV